MNYRVLLGFVANLVMLSGCVTESSKYFDSALNDHNRAPASLQLPKNFDPEVPILDAVHNQAEADFLFLKADLESQQGKSNEAIEFLKSALVYDPQSAAIMQKLSLEYYRRGLLRDATYWAERAYQNKKERRDLSLLLAGLYSSTKKYDEAVAIYESILKKDPEDLEVSLYLGAIYSEQKNFKAAVEKFKKAGKEKNPSQYLGHYYLARVYLEQDAKKNLKKVEQALRKSLELKPDFIDAITLLGQMIQKQKGIEQAYKFYAQHQKTKGPQTKLAEMLSQYYIEKGDYDKAYEQLEILDTSDDQVQVKLKMALILIDKKVYDLAIEKLTEILKFAPESDKVRFYLSAVYEEKRQFDLAYDQYMQIKKGSSYFEESRVHAAYLAKLMGDVPQGMKIMEEVLQGKVTNVQTYFLAAQFHEDQKHLDKALEIVRRAQKSFPKNAQAFYYEGTLYDKMNKKREMISSMEKALELDPENVQTLNYVAYSLAELGEQLDRAEKLARAAVQKDKSDGFMLDTLGWVLFKKGEVAEAAKVLEKAYELQPDVGIIAEHLGDAYIKLQKLDKARSVLLRANELEKDAIRKKDIEMKITSVEDSLKNQPRSPASTGLSSGKGESP